MQKVGPGPGTGPGTRCRIRLYLRSRRRLRRRRRTRARLCAAAPAWPGPPDVIGRHQSRVFQPACRRRTSAATAGTSTGTMVSTVISGPMPTGRSYLPHADCGKVTEWVWCLVRAL